MNTCTYFKKRKQQVCGKPAIRQNGLNNYGRVDGILFCRTCRQNYYKIQKKADQNEDRNEDQNFLDTEESFSSTEESSSFRPVEVIQSEDVINKQLNGEKR